MKKRVLMAMMGIVTMLAFVAVLAVNTKADAKACSWFEKVDVTLYLGNENADGFTTEVVSTKLTAKKLIKALQKKGAVDKGLKVRSFEDNDTTLVLNLSQTYADSVSSVGSTGEYIKVGCVVNTFLDAYDAKTILISVEGNAWESGHIVYDSPLYMYDNINQEPQDPEIEEPSCVEVNIYLGNENADALIANPMLVEEITPENLMKELKIYGGVAENVEILGFQNNNGSLVLDLSQAYADSILNSGSSGEYIKVGCVVNTFLEAYNASEITITVNGSEWESGHTVYDFPMTKFN